MSDKESRTAELGAPDKMFSRPEVVGILRSVMNNLMQDDKSIAHLYEQLDSIAKYIEQARSEVAALNPKEINEKHIVNASDELDAVIEATAEATGVIMDSCEEIEKIASKTGGETETEVINNITRIYEACSFQDITGQRITKVVNALKHIEGKVDSLLQVIGKGYIEKKADKSCDTGENDKDESLLNGPSTPAQGGVDQAEIDRLLSEFD